MLLYKPAYCMKAAGGVMVLRMITSNYAKKVQSLSGYTMCLSGFKANLASQIARSSLNHSYGYASADDRTICFAIFTLKPDPSCNMRVNRKSIRMKEFSLTRDIIKQIKQKGDERYG